MYVDIRVKYLLFLSDIIETWIFSTNFRNKSWISNFLKTCPVDADMFQPDGRTDRQTDMIMLIATFRNFATSPKNNKRISFQQ